MNVRVWRMLFFLSATLNAALISASYLEQETLVDTEKMRVRTEQEYSGEVSLDEKAKNEVDTNRATSAGSIEPAEVVRVVDGDTIVVRLARGERVVRVLGIDAPETGPTTAAECMAEESTKKLNELLGTTPVLLEPDSTQSVEDVYGRLIAYVRRHDGVDVGLTLVQEGYAREYTYKTPYVRQSVYKAAEDEAVLAERGLWSPSLCPVLPRTQSNTTKSVHTKLSYHAPLPTKL